MVVERQGGKGEAERILTVHFSLSRLHPWRCDGAAQHGMFCSRSEVTTVWLLERECHYSSRRDDGEDHHKYLHLLVPTKKQRRRETKWSRWRTRLVSGGRRRWVGEVVDGGWDGNCDWGWDWV